MLRCPASRASFAAAWITLLLCAVVVRPAPVLAVTGAPGFVIEDVFPNTYFTVPVQLVFFPDGRKLVVQENGIAWVMTPAGQKLPTPFIDISARTLSDVSGGRGMLGVALDPDFATNRWVYFAYTVDPDSDSVDDNDEAYARIERAQVSLADSNQIDPTTRQVLIGTSWSNGIPSLDTFHTIGALRFGSDKTLLVASGDGAHFDATDAGGLDPNGFLPGRTNPAEDLGSFRSLTLNSLAGKILRVDKETGLGLPSNPYWDGNPASARSRTWVYGVRNPFRFVVRPGTGSTDPTLGQPGTLYVGDTGWNAYEAVKVAPQGGLNMGWPCQEGPGPQPLYGAVTSTPPGNTNVLCGSPPSAENPVGYTAPFIWWHHFDGSQSYPLGWIGHATIGGTFQEGGSYPAPYAGSYFVADYGEGWIRWIQPDSTNHVVASGDFALNAGFLADLELDPVSGDLFYISLTDNTMHRIRWLPFSAPLVAVQADSASGAGPYPIPGAGSPWVDLAGSHDFALSNFAGNTSSGWQGNGTVLSPYRLSFDGVDDRATLAAGTLPEIQNAATTALWFKTGSNVTANQYLLEWLGDYQTPYPGMSIAIASGSLQVRLDSWVPVASIQPNTWYHVAVAKQDSTRVFVNGQQVYSSASVNFGGQASELVLGASTYRGPGLYGEFFGGSVARTEVWPRALSPLEALALYQAGQPSFVPSGTRFVHLRADSASTGGSPYAVPGSGSPWRDLISGYDANLVNFNGNLVSGWQGTGSPQAPYRLGFDGVDDRVTMPADTISSLTSPSAVTVGLWIKTGVDVTTTQYLLEWVSQYSAPWPGLTMAIGGGYFRVRLDSWVDVAPILPDTWYYLTLAKDGVGAVRAYVNESNRYTGTIPNLGGQASELVLGASTFRGPGNYGEYFRGAIAQVRMWRKALINPEVQEAFHESESLYLTAPPLGADVVMVRADSANGTGAYASGSNNSPWVNLAGPENAMLSHFNPNGAGGWFGAGTPSDPNRLALDGTNDRATFGAGLVAGLQGINDATTSIWFRTGADVNREQYLFQWTSQFTAPYPGMAMEILGGKLRALLGTWVDVCPVQANSWYQAAVSKEATGALAYVNGHVAALAIAANLGAQTSELVLGASTYRGSKTYGEYFEGSIGQLGVWPIAIPPTGIQQVFRADSARYLPTNTVGVPNRIPVTIHLSMLPNPFTDHSDIGFATSRAGRVDLSIYAVDGRMVRMLLRGWREAGSHRASWDGRDVGGRRVPNGVYFVRLVTADGTLARRVVVLR